MSALCSVMFSFLYLVMFISVLCSFMFIFLYLSILVMFMSVLCFVMFSFLYLVMFMSVLCSVMFSVLYLPSWIMFIKCILICECIWLFLSSSVVCLFFDTLYFSFLVFFNFINVLSVYLNLRVHLFVLFFVVEVLFRLAVFSRNLLAGDVHSGVALDRHVHACQWPGSISLLPWSLLSASACSLEGCGDSPTFLLLMLIHFES